MSAPILKLHVDEGDNISVLVSQDVQVLTCEEADRIEDEYERMQAENAKLRELAKGYENLTSALCNERECDGCPFDDPEKIVCKHMRLQTCLSELEIETK